MTADADRAGFAALAQTGADEDDAARVITESLRGRNDPERLKALAALWLHAATAAPEALPAVYDASAEGWLGEPVGGKPIPVPKSNGPASIPIPFWQALWDLIADSRRLGAAGVTTRSAALSNLIDPEVIKRMAGVAIVWPGVRMAAKAGLPKAFSADALAKCPPGSLGAAFRAQKPELALVRPAGRPPAPLDYLTARSAQTRGLMGLVGGYEATALHDVALYAFQLGQFGDHDAAKYLALILTRLAFEQPAGGPLMLQTILTAWTHGRRTPPLIAAPWEKLWDKPVEAVRTQLGVTPYASPFPADLIEKAAA